MKWYFVKFKTKDWIDLFATEDPKTISSNFNCVKFCHNVSDAVGLRNAVSATLSENKKGEIWAIDLQANKLTKVKL